MTVFFDTNILVYAVSDDDRRGAAQQALASGGVISVQVLNEFTNVLRKKLRQEWSRIDAALAVVRKRFDTINPLTDATHGVALALARDHGLNFYDALIVASALEAGCDTLLTEDLPQGRMFSAVQIRNPFL